MSEEIDSYEFLLPVHRKFILFTPETATMAENIYHALPESSETYPKFPSGVMWKFRCKAAHLKDEHWSIGWYSYTKDKQTRILNTRLAIIGDWRALAGLT